MSFALAYLALCAVAKGYTAWLHAFEWSWTSPAAMLWHDAIIALGVGALTMRWRRAGGVVYWTLALHLVACMPLLTVLGTPSTRALLSAAGGALGDSIVHYLNARHLAPVLLMSVLAAVLPRFLKSISEEKSFGIAGALLLAIAVSGWSLRGRSEVHGLQRNFAAALLKSYTTREQSVTVGPQREHHCFSAPGAGSAIGLNLLVITLESTASRFLGTYGAQRDAMPYLSALAQEGWVLENAYAPYPESVKGLLCVLASRQPRFGLKERDFAELASPSLPCALSAHGYETALFHSGRFMYLGMDTLVRNSGFQLSEDAAAIGGERESSFGVDDRQTVERILTWLDSRRTQSPFYVHYLPISGHHPYGSPPGPWEGSDDRSRYLNALHYSDLLLEKLLSGLQSRGILQETLVVIFGDHGEAFGEHPGNYGHTLAIYEENVRVPLIFWAPGLVPAGRCERVTTLVDVAPTICDLLGVRLPTTFEGLSLLASAARPALFITDYSLQLAGVREEQWKYIYERDSGYSRLFNLADDPDEQWNVAGVYPERVARYRSELLMWQGAENTLRLTRSP